MSLTYLPLHDWHAWPPSAATTVAMLEEALNSHGISHCSLNDVSTSAEYFHVDPANVP